MNIFRNVDQKLVDVSQQLGATLTKDRPGYPQEMRTFEERRIDWFEEGINKAIIIQPTFESGGLNSELWNFSYLAWIGVAHKKKKIVDLVNKENFSKIEEDIDLLLQRSLDALLNISEKELH